VKSGVLSCPMDEATAWRLFNEQTTNDLSVVIRGERFDGVMITELKLPGRMTLLLRTRVGEPNRYLTVDIDKVELAPEK
jgi:hypothetical protein